jgi:hypothetical protein
MRKIELSFLLCAGKDAIIKRNNNHRRIASGGNSHYFLGGKYENNGTFIVPCVTVLLRQNRAG